LYPYYNVYNFSESGSLGHGANTHSDQCLEILHYSSAVNGW